jgi:GntR family transcriptional regulator
VFILSPQSGTPIYRQILEQARRLIASGQLAPGAPLPSVRELAHEHAVNPMTISKAYAMLESEGLLERNRGKPMTVALRQKNQAALKQRLQELEDEIRQLVLAARQLQLRKRDVVALLNKRWEDEEDDTTGRQRARAR